MVEFNWYCPYCDEYLTGEEVTYEEMHDPRYGGCGYPVQGKSDPNEGSYDTLEEKELMTYYALLLIATACWLGYEMFGKNGTRKLLEDSDDYKGH